MFSPSVILFIVFGGLALGCALSMVVQRNPLYSAISLVGVFLSLACIYVTLSAPFIAAVQIIVYAGAIMVLVVFVIMLLNVEDEVRRPVRLHYLIPIGVGLATVLIAETAFMLTLHGTRAQVEATQIPDAGVGLTTSIGTGLFTEYLLPFEVTSVLILMALVGAMTLARRASSAIPQSREDFGTAGEMLTPELVSDGSSTIQPGLTAVTGRALAREQIAQADNASASTSNARGEKF